MNITMNCNNWELEALQNFADKLGLKVHINHVQDKRKTIMKYFLADGTLSVSPVFNYNELNCFMIGWLNSKTKGVYNATT